MNDISFIICEFNPLHFGHRRIISEAAVSPLVCIMSGNYVQRGEPSVLDKWSRTEAALRCGANLVVELPLPWACAGAEKFADGGATIADAFGIGGKLFFGSESGSIDELNQIAEALLSDEFQEKLREKLIAGKITFAKSREEVVLDMLGRKFGKLLSMPNNILGIEYIKALKKLKSAIVPEAVERIGAAHDGIAKNCEIMSASEIRGMLKAGKDISDCMPHESAEILKSAIDMGYAPVFPEGFEKLILGKLRSMTAEDFAVLPDISEGLDSKLFSSVKKARTLEELYALCKTKRYTHSRIRRLVLSAFLGITSDLPQKVPYIRILGMDKTGEEIIKKTDFELPLLVRATDYKEFGEDVRRVFELEAAADDIYTLMMPKPQTCGWNYTKKVVKI